MSVTLAHTTFHPSILCWAASHARTSLLPARARAWRVKDPAYSTKSCAFVARWHPGSSVLRTSQLSIIGDLMPFSGTLPRAAIVSGMAIFEHPTWAHRTVESDGSRSPGGSAWPTPTVSEAERGHGYQRSGDRLYPTLTGAVGATKHWPTVLAGDHRCAGPNQNTATLGRRVRNIEGNARLNPRFVEALMGFPDNWTAIDGPPHQDHSTHGSRRGPDPDSDTTGND